MKKIRSRITAWLQNLYNLLLDVRICILKVFAKKNNKKRTSATDDVVGYDIVCRLAAEDENIFKVFKRSSVYRQVLEHVSKKQGQEYLDIITKEGADLLEYFPEFQKNDLLGNPVTCEYDVGSFSPTTLRYVKVLSDLRSNFLNLDNMDIVEIGCGYGGQCKIISDVTKYKSYTIIDLDIVLPLIKKYLNRLGVTNICYSEASQINNNEIFDLVISNYAFSECVKNVQDEYMAKVLNRSRRGYITYNYGGHSHRASPYTKSEIIGRLSEKHSVRIVEERPKTGSENFIIIWDDNVCA